MKDVKPFTLPKAGFPLANFFARSDYFRRRNISRKRVIVFHRRNYKRANDMARNTKSRKNKMAALNTRRLLLLRNNLLRLFLLRRRRKRTTKYKKRFWIRRVYAERQQKGEFHLLVKELILFDQEYFFKCFRMSPTLFEELLSWTGHQLQRRTTRMREPIGPRERLCVCLRYLVTGDAQMTIATSYRMSPGSCW
jgi:hypothetical protein